jgi:hypothetical protein
MYWRPIRAAELSACLELQPACLGDHIVGRKTALQVWTRLVDQPAFQGRVIVSDPPIGGHAIAGCGLGVFVSSQFADREICDPRPGLNSRIIAGIVAGEPILPDYLGLCRANAGKGVDFVIMYGTWREGILSPEQLSEFQRLLGTSFVEHFAGFRFNRILKESVGAPLVDLARKSGVYRVVAEFPESESVLAVVSRESAFASTYSLGPLLYRFEAPVLRLGPGQQELLQAALSGRTDRELSRDLGLTIEATKKRWFSIFARVEQFKPELFVASDNSGDGRGLQKRHHVIAYVRAHPEELRPYYWGSREVGATEADELAPDDVSGRELGA